MLAISRGLFALFIPFILSTALTAEYLYTDDVVQKTEFTDRVEILGQELYEKTGISLKLVMVRELPLDTNIQSYQASILEKASTPTILLTFAELHSQIDISVSDASLYTYFNREQVLSPVASTAQAFVMGLFFAESFKDFWELLSNSGGSILPLLGSKAKEGKLTGKYAAALFNGYVDIAIQIASSHNIELENAKENNGKYILMALKTAFYGVIVMALVMYIRRRLYARRKKRELG